jgi:circadian clock protein KaiC
MMRAILLYAMGRTAEREHGGEARGLPKALTGIEGLDQITGGGLPRGRPTLICGTAGCGKTLLAMQFLVRGAIDHDEPGVFVAFEETADELTANVRSLGFDLDRLVDQRKLIIDHVRVERSELEDTGDYTLDGLFIRLGHAIDTLNARRVVLDTLEVLFSKLSNTTILRAELRRLFGWLKDKGVTAVITGERAEGQLTRHGLEEYVSDCVILLDNRVDDQLSTRRLRIVKYRGTAHGTNEYPFLIDENGISVMPITSLGLDYDVSEERISSGVAGLDAMLGGKGFFSGSSVLVSGTAGTGKSSVTAHVIDAACRRGERCMLFSFEEGTAQVVRNMRSIGIDLQPWIDAGLLQVRASRPSLYGLEMHLVAIHKAVRELRPHVVVIDPITNLISVGSARDTTAMLVRLIDFLKANQITAVLTSLTTPGEHLERTDADVSSLIDTWLLLRVVEHDGERTRVMYVLKSRGMSHSHQVREYRLTDDGIVVDPASDHGGA